MCDEVDVYSSRSQHTDRCVRHLGREGVGCGGGSHRWLLIMGARCRALITRRAFQPPMTDHPAIKLMRTRRRPCGVWCMSRGAGATASSHMKQGTTVQGPSVVALPCGRRFVCRRRLGGRRGEAAAYLTPIPPDAIVYGMGDAARIITKV